MRRLIFILLLSSSFNGNAQILSGGIVDEGRKLITETDFTFTGRVSGFVEYEVAVDRKGNITSVALGNTNIKSTPALHQVRSEIMKLKFEPGTYYPQFHHAVIRFHLKN